MIPIIGSMVGMYILVRCASFLARKGERKEAAIVRVLAVITIISALVGILMLNASGIALLNDLSGELTGWELKTP